MKGTYLFVTFLYFIIINTNRDYSTIQGVLGVGAHPSSQI